MSGCVAAGARWCRAVGGYTILRRERMDHPMGRVSTGVPATAFSKSSSVNAVR